MTAPGGEHLLPRCEHVWLTHIRDEPRPGLLVWWRRSTDKDGRPRWEGWVVYALPTIRGVCVVQDWVLAEHIRRRT